MNILYFISMLLAAVSGLFALVRQYQMLQQNSYFPSRYYAWVKTGYTLPLTAECFGFCLSSLLFSRGLYTVQLILTAAVLAIRVVSAVRVQKKSIRKLVFTARIKRLFGAAALLFALLICLYAAFPRRLAGEIAGVLCFTAAYVSPLLCLLCRLLTAPIDNAVTRWYINDAKRILAEQKNLIVIGVTGSYGKTSVKFILNRILSEKYNVVATPQSFNTPMGVVRTIREKLEPQTQIFICEMGAKKVGDIKEICDIVHPNYGIITSVGEQHLETFGSLDNVFRTKFELADEVLKNSGTVFVNGDSEELFKRIDPSRYVVYGTGEGFPYRAKEISYGRDGASFTVAAGEKRIALSAGLLGRHNVINLTGAAALADTLGVSPADIAFAAAALKPTEHRLELKPYLNGSLLIDDAYNANPEGCIEAVRVLAGFDDMKKVIVTPGLVELGEKEYDCNFALGVEAAEKCDIIILVGINRSKPLKAGAESVGFDPENLYVVASFRDAMDIYKTFADQNTVVLFENDLPDNYLN